MEEKQWVVTYVVVLQPLHWNFQSPLWQHSPACLNHYSSLGENSSCCGNHSSQELVLDLQLLVIWLVI
jgi:hypothetical protein